MENTVEPTKQIFLSYGRKDASDLAERLKTDLEADGYSVCRDASEIRAGSEWEMVIQTAIEGSDVVVAVLSPHSVRVSSADARISTDSVCLDELSFARFSSSPTPIVPVMAVSCTPPFSIFRLDYMDMTSWKASEHDYQLALNRLREGISAALRGERVPMRKWFHKLDPLDFTPYLDDKRQGFVGRQWFHQSIMQWLMADPDEVALLIVGDPDIGKTAFVAASVHGNPDGCILAFHCCRHNSVSTLEASNFVRSTAAMIASQVPEYAERLEDSKLQRLLKNPAIDENPVHAFENAVLLPLNALDPPSDGNRFILVDGLDECLGQTALRYNLAAFLADESHYFPSWLRLVATTRKNERIEQLFGDARVITLKAQDVDNQKDIEHYITNRLGALGAMAEAKIDDDIPRLLSAADGNFLYAKTALDDWREGEFSESKELPAGLGGLYLRFFDRIFGKPDGEFFEVRELLEVLTAAADLLPLSVVERASGIEPEYALPKIMRQLSSFILVTGSSHGSSRIGLFHKSLADWLSSQDCPYRASVAIGNRRLVEAGVAYLGHLGNLDRMNSERGYWSDNLLRHIARAEYWDLLIECFIDKKKSSFLFPVSYPGGLWDCTKPLPPLSRVFDYLPWNKPHVLTQFYTGYVSLVHDRLREITITTAAELTQRLGGSKGEDFRDLRDKLYSFVIHCGQLTVLEDAYRARVVAFSAMRTGVTEELATIQSPLFEVRQGVGNISVMFTDFASDAARNWSLI